MGVKKDIRLISTDFDGTLFSEFETPPVPQALQHLLGEMQQGGAKWVINTGRDLSSLMETLGRARLEIRPDFLVIVEREIYIHENHSYIALHDWNDACRSAHDELFRKVRRDLPELVEWINNHYDATIYEDTYSPFCLIAENPADAEAIHTYLENYTNTIPSLSVVRNDIYARLSHTAFNKGTALQEIARRLRVTPDQIVAAGDHLNDIPMLSLDYARWLIAPGNAIPQVKELVNRQGGLLSALHCGHGVAQGLRFLLAE